MKKKNGFFYMFFNSIYDLNAFSAYAKKGLMKSIIYAVLMVTILGSIRLSIESYNINQVIKEIINELESDAYDIRIENNILKINKPFIAFNEGGNLIYFDSNLEIDDVDKIKSITVHEEQYVLCLKNGIVFKDIDNKHIIKYDLLLNHKLTIYNELNNLKLLIISTIFVYKLVIMIFNFFINCFIVAMISNIITLFMKMIVKSKALYSLTIYVSTLPFIIETVLNIIRPDIDFDLIFIAGSLTYMIFILRYIKKDIIERINSGKFKI